MHTAIPAVIVTYNAALQSATVQPVIRQRVDDVLLNREVPDVAPIPPLANVPVVWPSGLTWSSIGPLTPGDPVTLVFVERSTDEWRATGNPDNIAQDARRFDIADAVCYPGGRAFNPANAVTGPRLVNDFDPVAMVYGTTVPAGIKLGGSSAIDFVLKGTIFEADLLTFLNAFGVWLSNTSTWLTATGAFQGAFSTWLVAFQALLVALANPAAIGAWLPAVRAAAGVMSTATGIFQTALTTWTTATTTFGTATSTFTTAGATFTTTVSGGAHRSLKVLVQ